MTGDRAARSVMRNRHPSLRTDGLYHDGIHGKGMLREHRLAAGPEKNTGNHVQHVVGTVSQGDAIGRDGMLLGQAAG